MDRMLYIAADGASQIQKAQAVNANNLANVSTTGFKAHFEALRALPVYGPGYASRVHSQTEISGVDQSPGALMATGRSLDIAVNGTGWIAIQAPEVPIPAGFDTVIICAGETERASASGLALVPILEHGGCGAYRLM